MKKLFIICLFLVGCDFSVDYHNGYHCEHGARAFEYEACIANESCNLTGKDWLKYERATDLRDGCKAQGYVYDLGD
jgi:hypothetical protein